MRKINSFRPLRLTTRCRWITYNHTVHTIIMHVKKTNKLITYAGTRESQRDSREILREIEILRERETGRVSERERLAESQRER